MSRKPLQNLALLVVALAVGILGLEAFLRLFPQLLPEEARLRLHWSAVGEGTDANGQVLTVADPYLGFRYRPNLTGRLKRGDLDFTFTTDEKGFRNNVPLPDRADIVVVGDSMAFGYGVPDDATWTHLVATQFARHTISNFGLIGGAPQQYLRILETEALELHPKLVLFMLFPGNDLNDSRLFQQWLEASTDTTYPEFRFAGGTPSDWHALRRLSGGSYLVAFQRALRSRLLSGGAGETITLGNGQRVQLAPTVYDNDALMAAPEHPVFQLVMATIEEAQRLSRRQGSHFLVLLMPTKEEVYLPLLDKPAPALIEKFRPALEAQRIPFLDLTPYLRAATREVGPVFLEVDGHPNAVGYQVIADVVVDYLNEHGATYGLGDRQPQRSIHDAFQACCSDRIPGAAAPRASAWPGSATYASVGAGSIDSRARSPSIRPARTPAGWRHALGARGGSARNVSAG
jgi:lysophospholipase L1-like esterase